MLKKFTYAEHWFFKDPGFRFHIGTSVITQSVFEQHRHQFAELAVILGGSSLHRVDNETYSIGQGDIFVINTRTSHGFSKMKNLRICNIMYDPAQFLAPFPELTQLPGYHALFRLEPVYRRQDQFRSRLHLIGPALDEVEALVTLLTNEQEAKGAGHRTAIRTRFIELVLLLCRRYSSVRTDASRRLLRLGNVTAYLETKYMEPIRVPDLAAMAHLSVNQFLRVFKKLYQKTPTEYLLKVRILKAGELLRRSAMSITDIGFEVGFTDSNYFSRVFRREMGTTPRGFRKNNTTN